MWRYVLGRFIYFQCCRFNGGARILPNQVVRKDFGYFLSFYDVDCVETERTYILSSFFLLFVTASSSSSSSSSSSLQTDQTYNAVRSFCSSRSNRSIVKVPFHYCFSFRVITVITDSSARQIFCSCARSLVSIDRSISCSIMSSMESSCIYPFIISTHSLSFFLLILTSLSCVYSQLNNSEGKLINYIYVQSVHLLHLMCRNDRANKITRFLLIRGD